MSVESQRQLRSVVRQAVDASRRPVRELERMIGLGSGNLARLLDGRLEIRIDHLLGLAEVLAVPPADFLELAFAERSAAKYRLRDWLQPAVVAPRGAAAAAPLDAAALADLVRGVVREELARQSPAAPAAK